jgi:hypothetical protein
MKQDINEMSSWQNDLAPPGIPTFDVQLKHQCRIHLLKDPRFLTRHDKLINNIHTGNE